MELCLSGRGALPLLRMDPAAQAGMNRFLALPMQPNHPTRGWQWLVTPAPKLEAVNGLLNWVEPEGVAAPLRPARLNPATPQQLMYGFLLTFRSQYPAAFLRLFPQACDENGRLTAAAAQIIQQAAVNAVNAGQNTLPMLCATILTALLQG